MACMNYVCILALGFVFAYAPIAVGELMETNHIRFDYSNRGITGIASPADPYQARVTSVQRPLELTLRYQMGSDAWQDLFLAGSQVTASQDDRQVTYSASDEALSVTQTFQLNDKVLDWDIELAATSNRPVTIGDLAISIPVNGPRGETPEQIFATYIDPKQDESDRRWHPFVLDLDLYAGSPVTLTLETSIGPAGDYRYDWAGWGEPRLLIPPPVVGSNVNQLVRLLPFSKI